MARRRYGRRRGFRAGRNQHFQIHMNLSLSQQNQSDKIIEPIPPFFNDPQNPYRMAPIEIKQLFYEEEGQLKIKPIEIKPEQFFNPSQKNNRFYEVCTKNLEQNYSYVCYTCFSDGDSRICQECFNPAEHINHYYQACDKGNDMICSCGKRANSKEYFSCKKHNFCTLDIQSKIDLFKIQQNQSNEKQFIEYFSSLFQIIFYLYRRAILSNSNYATALQELKKQVNKSFNLLLTNQPQLFPIAEKLLNQKISVRFTEVDHPVSILQNILRMEYSEILTTMVGNINFCHKLVYLWYNPQNTGIENVYIRQKGSRLTNSIQNHLKKIPNLLLYLYDKKVFIVNNQIFEQAYRNYGEQIIIDNKTLFHHYLEHNKIESSAQDFFDMNINTLRDCKNLKQKTCNFIVKCLFEYLVKDKNKSKNQKDRNCVEEKSKKDQIKQDCEEEENENEGSNENEEDQECQISESKAENVESNAQGGNQNDEEENSGEQQDEEQQDEEDEDEEQENEEQSKQKHESSSFPQNRDIQIISKLECESVSPQQKFSKQQIYKFKKQDLQSNLLSINSCMLHMLDCNFANFSKLPQIFEEFGYQPVLFQEFLSYLVKIREKGSHADQNDAYFFIIASYSPNKSTLYKKYLNKMLLKQQPQTHISVLFDLLNKMANLFVQNFSNSLSTEEKKQKALNLWKSYLYQNKRMYGYDLSQKKYEKSVLLDYEESSQIMKSLCTFILNEDDDEQSEFIYTSLQEYPNLLVKFTLGIQNILKGSFLTYESSIKKEQIPEIMLTFMKSIFSDKSIIKKITDQFNKTIRELKAKPEDIEQLRQEEKVLHYFYFLIIIHHFGDPQSVGTDAIIEEVRNKEELCKKYSELVHDGEKLLRMLNIQNIKKNKTERQEKDEKERLEQLKKKAQTKKEKLKKKYQERNQQLLGLHATQSMIRDDEVNENEDMCLLCRQNSKPNNPLAYVALIKKNSTLGYSIFGEADVSRTFVSSCFHCVHILCYQKVQKRNGSFSCLLCQKKCNCLIPRSYSQQNKRIFKICTNILIANFVYNFNCLQVQSLFMILFKHVVQSKGLYMFALGDMRFKKQYSMSKVNQFIEKFLIQLYETAKQGDKEDYDKDLQQFVEIVKKCEKQSFKEIQLAITTALIAKIKKNAISGSDLKLNKLKEILNIEDYLIVKNQISEYIDQADASDEDFHVEKPDGKQQKSSLVFKPYLPPKTSLELPQFGSNKCSTCDSICKYAVCLVCGSSFCNKCFYEEKHQKSHRQRLISFLCDEGEISVQNGNNSDCSYVYKSAFNISLGQICFESNTNRDIYYLKENIMEKLLDQFYQD